VRVQQFLQERGELIRKVRRLLAELAEQDTDVALVDAKVRGQILAACHGGDGSATWPHAKPIRS
jgi:hypothetical protein